MGRSAAQAGRHALARESQGLDNKGYDGSKHGYLLDYSCGMGCCRKHLNVSGKTAQYFP